MYSSSYVCRCPRALLLAASLLVALRPTRAVAQLVQCSGVAGSTNYKVLVDEVRYAAGAAPATPLSIELITSSVEGALEKVRSEVLGSARADALVDYLNCAGRHPRGSGDFDATLVHQMAANHAVLEIWGTVSPAGNGKAVFNIEYVMFPIASLTAPPPSGIAHTERTLANKPGPQEVLQYLTTTRAELPAYFAVAAGAQAFADHRWVVAARLLCTAHVRMQRIKGTNLEDLMKYADQLAARAAAATRGSDIGVIALLSDAEANDYCTFASTR